MVAYFSSKLIKRFQTAIAVTALLICMLGTHWFGYAHGVSHLGLQKQSISQASADHLSTSFSHNTDICHLFDGLTLAGFIPKVHINNFWALTTLSRFNGPQNTLFNQAAPTVYQSRAPPSLLA